MGIAQTYFYDYTIFDPFFWIFVDVKCIIFTGVTPQILRIQFSLLRNSWIFRKNTSYTKWHLIKYNNVIRTVALHVQNFHRMADTHACSQLRLSFTALSRAFSGEADQIRWSAFVNLGTFFSFGSGVIRLQYFLKPDNTMDWGRMNWGPLIIGDEVTAIWLDETWNWKR